MIFFVIIGLIILCYIFFCKKPAATKELKKVQTFDYPTPSDYIHYASGQVAGLYFRKKEAKAFAGSSDQSLEFEREPDNLHDKNAIKIIGITHSSRYFIGYIDKDLAKQIIETGVLPGIQIQLTRIYQGYNDYIEIQFNIIGLI